MCCVTGEEFSPDKPLVVNYLLLLILIKKIKKMWDPIQYFLLTTYIRCNLLLVVICIMYKVTKKTSFVRPDSV